MQIQPTIRKARRQNLSKFCAQSRDCPRRLGITEYCRQLAARCKVNFDLLRSPPIGRDLQDRRATQAAMSDQHLFAEWPPVERCDHLGRNASQIAIMGAILRTQHQWDKPRPRVTNLESKLARQVVPQRSRTNLGNG